MSQQAILLACIHAAAASLAAPGDAIQLKRSVRLDPSVTSVTLEDVAILTGDDALSLASTIVASHLDPSTATSIDVATIRTALTTAGAHWGHIDLSGHAVAIRPAPRPAAGVPLAMSPLAIDAPSIAPTGSSGATVAMANPGTVAGEVARLLAKKTGLSPDRVRVTFGKTDPDILKRVTDGRRIEIRPRSSMTGVDRVAIEAIEWSDGRMVRRDAIDAHLTICVQAATATSPLSRGHRVGEDDFAITDVWTTPTKARFLAPANDLTGRSVAIRIEDAGVIHQRDLVTPIMIKRGDIVQVHCLVGSVVIRMKATAQDQAGLGGAIELRRSRHESPFMATVTGPGEARIDASMAIETPDNR